MGAIGQFRRGLAVDRARRFGWKLKRSLGTPAPLHPRAYDRPAPPRRGHALRAALAVAAALGFGGRRGA